MKSRKLMSTVLAVVLVTALAVAAIASPAAFDQKIVSQISVPRMMEDVRYLSEDIGVRIASSPEEEMASDYIADVFQKYGYDVEIQEFPYANRIAYVTMLEPEMKKIDVRIGGSRTNAPLTGPEGITGKVVDCGFGGPEEFPAEVEGNIALIRRGQQTFVNMYNNARAAGAVAVLIQNYSWTAFSANVGTATIPYATLNDEAGELLRGGNVVINYKSIQADTSRNVIATRKPDNKNKDTGYVVVLSAHYDSVPTAPGANDNGSGTAALLELARILKSQPIDMEIRFLACGAEEVGLVGSRYYVSQLSAQERERIIANYNMDMVATAGEAQSLLYVNTLDGDNLVARTARAAAERLGYSDYLLAPYHRGSSDHQAFYEGGIEGGNFIWREPGTAALEPWYHQPHDTMEHISQERFKIAADIVGAACYSVIRPDTPSLIHSRTGYGETIELIEFVPEGVEEVPEI